MRRTAAGDRDAFETLYRTHQATVYRFARLMTGSTTIAEDIVQEVFLSLMRDAARYDPARASLTTYLYGSARHHTRRRLLRDRLFVRLDDEAVDLCLPATSANAADDLIRQRDVQQLRRAIVRLPARYREVIVLVRPAGRELRGRGAGARLRARHRAVAAAPRAASARGQAAARCSPAWTWRDGPGSEVRGMKHSERGDATSRASAAGPGRDRGRDRDAVPRRNRGHGALGCVPPIERRRTGRGPAVSCAGQPRRRRASRSSAALAWQRGANGPTAVRTLQRRTGPAQDAGARVHDRGRRRRTAAGRRADSRRADASRAIGARRAGHSRRRARRQREANSVDIDVLVGEDGVARGVRVPISEL